MAERTPKTSDALGSPFAVSRPARREDFWTPSLLRTLEPNASPAAGSRLQERRPEPCSRRDPQSGAGRGGGRGVPAAGCRPGPARPGARRQPRGAVGGVGGAAAAPRRGPRVEKHFEKHRQPHVPPQFVRRFFFFFFYILFCRGAGEPCGSKSAVAVSTSCTRVRLAHSAPLLTYWGEGKNTQRN